MAKIWKIYESVAKITSPLSGLLFMNIQVSALLSWPGTTFLTPPPPQQTNSYLYGVVSWPNNECWLGSFVIFQGIQTSIAKKPYIFVIFQGV